MGVRFEETADMSWKSESEDEARACLAAARAFREGELGENLVVRATIEVIFEALLDDLRGKLAESGDQK